MTQKDKFKDILANFRMDVEDAKIYNKIGRQKPDGEALEEAVSKSADIAYKEAKTLFAKKC